jgi:hypothetical protein
MNQGFGCDVWWPLVLDPSLARQLPNRYLQSPPALASSVNHHTHPEFFARWTGVGRMAANHTNSQEQAGEDNRYS